MSFTSSPVIRLFGHRQFLFLWLGQLTSQFAANMTLFLLALVIYKNTGSNTAVSGLFIAFGVPSVLFGMVAGTLVDKVDKKAIIFWSSIVRSLLVIGLLFVTKNIFFVYVLLFLNAVVTQLFVPAEATMIPKLVPGRELVTANSFFSFAYYSSMAVGFVLAGPLLRIAGPYLSLGILSMMFLITAWTASRLPTGDDRVFWKKIQSINVASFFTKVIGSLRDGFSYVAKSKVLFDSLLLLTATQIIIAMLGTLGPGFADKVLQIDVTDASTLILGPAVLGIILGAVWVGSKGYHYGADKLIKTGIIGAGMMLLFISITIYLRRYAGFGWLFNDSVIIPLEFFLFFLLGVANSFLDVPANSILQKEAQGDMRGRVYGLLGACVGGVGIIPVMAGGILADTIGVGRVIFSLGLVIFCYGLFRIRYTKT